MGSFWQVGEQATVPTTETILQQTITFGILQIKYSHTFITNIMDKWTIAFLLSFVSLLVLTNGAPKPSPQEDYDEDSYGDFTGEEDSDTSEGPVDLLRFGAGALNGFLGLLQAKIGLLRSLLGNKELHQQIGGAIKTGLDVTRGIVAAKVGVVRTVADVAPDVIEGTRSGTRLIGSVVRAANDTAPLILDGIQEFTDQIPLITGFASAYAEVNAEQAQKVVGRFVGSFQCDQQCKDLVDEDLKAECEQQFCQQEEEEDSYDDYYDESN